MTEDARVCHRCFGDEFLKKRGSPRWPESRMLLLRKSTCYPAVRKSADLFESAIETHYRRTPSGPSEMEQAMQHHGLMGFWYPEGQPVLDFIEEIGETSSEVAEDIRSLLEDRHSTREDYEMGLSTEFDPESHYENRATPKGELDEEWPHFKHNLQTKSRYMSVAALRTLDKIFHGLEAHRTHQNKPVIVEAGPGKAINTLFRARVFQSDQALFEALKCPEISLGPPPTKVATAGRMNARGIPVFYGATDRKTALAEVRPPVGSKVIVAQFEITRSLCLFDVESLRSISTGGSPFDPSYLTRKQDASFLSDLSEEITRPVMPDDETLNYIPTQVIAEYLASLETPQLDGMLYASVQAGNDAQNVVLFNKAAVVASVTRPPDVSFDVTDYENYESGPETEYSVRENFDSEYVAPEPAQPTPEQYVAEMHAVLDDREAALKVSLENVWVHRINRVAIEDDDYKVDRRSWDKKSFRDFEKTQLGRAATETMPEDFDF